MYGWTFPKEELAFSPGIIPAMYQHTAEYNGIEYVCSPLKIDNGNYFTIDFEDFERKAADPMMKACILAHPHNPSGRVWTEGELRRIAQIVEKNNLWIISDEIHCDLLRNGKKHIPLGKIMPDYKKLITCMSARKTFNMAVLMLSDITIREPQLRKIFTNFSQCYEL